MKILIVEHEPSLNKSMMDYLSSQGYICEEVSNYAAVSSSIDLSDFDCIVLNIMPDGGAQDLLDRLKAEKKTERVIIISAQDIPDDKVIGLKDSGYDYLIKPFHLAELSMRVSAAVRRKNATTTNQIKFREIKIETGRHWEVTVNGQIVPLTKTEYRLLLYFIINRNKVLTMSNVAEHIWRDDMELCNNFDFIYTHIKNLRKKLQNSGCMNYLHNVYGIGYKFS